MIGCIADPARALRHCLLAAGVGALQLAVVASASAQTQSLTVDELVRQLEGRPVSAEPKAQPPAKGRVFRPRSFSAKDPETEAAPAIAAPVAEAPIEHPQVDIEIYFTPASARITKQAEPELVIIGKALSNDKFAKSKFRIAGHTDGIGGAAYNLDLSKRRAEAVRRYLVDRFKIPAAHIEAVGYGKEQLKVPEDIASARNRRVQIVNLSAAK